MCSGAHCRERIFAQDQAGRRFSWGTYGSVEADRGSSTRHLACEMSKPLVVRRVRAVVRDPALRVPVRCAPDAARADVECSTERPGDHSVGHRPCVTDAERMLSCWQAARPSTHIRRAGADPQLIVRLAVEGKRVLTPEGDGRFRIFADGGEGHSTEEWQPGIPFPGRARITPPTLASGPMRNTLNANRD